MTATKTYTLTCTGSGGTATQSTTVAVNTAPVSEPTGLSCTGTSGPLTLRAKAVRDTGISPLLVFFDATGTTDSSLSGRSTAFQDVTYTWNFGDTGASGTSTWAYGSNPGHNSRNTATGGVAAHLYVTPGVDTAYVATVTAHNGAYTASCQLAVTAYDPSGANGFPGAATTCVSSSSTPVAGSGGCPAGARVLNASSVGTALGSSYFGSHKRVLFKCGNRFTGTKGINGAITWSIGAYGGCENTQTNRPILSGNGIFSMYMTNLASIDGDGRFSDLDCEGTDPTTGYCIQASNSSSIIPYQITMYNLNSSGSNISYEWAQGAQWGLIGSTQTQMYANQGTFVNYAENNPAAWASGGSPFPNIDYQALIGDYFNGQGAKTTSGVGIETVRSSACRLCVFENSSFINGNNVGAVLKMHDGNTFTSSPTWTGVYMEYIMETDNLFAGVTGSQLVENSPQNSIYDERQRYTVIERNIFNSTVGGGKLLVSGVNMTIRDNVFYWTTGGAGAPDYGVQVAQRGAEPVPQGVEVYNNTCVSTTNCVGLDGKYYNAPPINSYAKNNLYHISSGSFSTVVNTGTGNTVSNNTTTVTANPGFTNGSGTFRVISDFKPTAYYWGGTSVPVWSDALGALWATAWDLGAVHP
jgi:hypothetical protein